MFRDIESEHVNFEMAVGIHVKMSRGHHPSGLSVLHLPVHQHANIDSIRKLKSNRLGDTLIPLVHSISLVGWLNMIFICWDLSLLSGPTHCIKCLSWSSG